MKTYLEREEFAYGARGPVYGRPFVAHLGAYSTKYRRYLISDFMVKGTASIPDTYFTIPARAKIKGSNIKGYLVRENDTLVFCLYREDEK